MESKIKSNFFRAYRTSGPLSNYRYTSAVFIPFDIYLDTGDSGGATISISANSSKQIVYDGEMETDPSIWDGWSRSYTSYDFSYRDSRISATYPGNGYSLGPILGFFSGHSHLAFSGICRYTAYRYDDNSNIFLANTNSSAASLTVATANTHVIHYLINDAAQLNDDVLEQYDVITKYIMNETTE